MFVNICLLFFGCKLFVRWRVTRFEFGHTAQPTTDTSIQAFPCVASSAMGGFGSLSTFPASAHRHLDARFKCTASCASCSIRWPRAPGLAITQHGDRYKNPPALGVSALAHHSLDAADTRTGAASTKRECAHAESSEFVCICVIGGVHMRHVSLGQMSLSPRS